MINFFDGLLTDLLQNDSKYNPEIQALAYALRLEKQRIAEEADTTRTLAMIEQLPEEILDVLAVELRTPYYTEDMTITQKRAIISGTLVWFYHAGTPSAVEEMIAAIFGQGEVVEWFDFTEAPFTPGTFDIVTDTRMTEDIVAQFLQIISRVKNTRSHLRRVMVERHGYQDEFIGTGIITAPKTPVLNSTDSSSGSHGGQTAIGAGAMTAPREPIVNHASARQRAATGPAYIGTALAARSHTGILNCPPPSTETITRTERHFTAAAAMHSTILVP